MPEGPFSECWRRVLSAWFHGVWLTDQGRRVALEVLHHRRLLELFLAQELGMSWDRVHAEAEALEHVLSEELEELIAARLGHPAVDPHGDPIPTPLFEIDERPTRSLDELPVGTADGSFACRILTRRCCATWPSWASG